MPDQAPVNPPQSPRNLIAKALEWSQQGMDIALVTLINIEGNAPYPVGSQMLVNERGEFLGQISGGCAESSIAEQAVGAMRQCQNMTQRYGLDSPFFDIQLPCGSGIDVHIDVSISDDALLEMKTKLEQRESVTVQLVTDIGTIQQQYLPERRLILFGQGAAMSSLARLATLSGFESLCFVQDQSNQRRLQAHGIESAVLNSETDFQQFCDRHAAMVSLFHEHELEIPILQTALQTELFYIGALGSTKTQEQRFRTLEELGVAENELSRIHGPVGFDLNANTPEHIAVSILAEVISLVPTEI